MNYVSLKEAIEQTAKTSRSYSEEVEVREWVTEEDGTEVLKITRHDPICEMIQKAGVGTTLKELVNMMRQGDESAAQQLQELSDSNYYADVYDMPELQDMLRYIRQSEEKFEQLPSDYRDQFNNDPKKWIAAIKDTSIMDLNKQYLQKIGKWKDEWEKIPEVQPVKVQVVGENK